MKALTLFLSLFLIVGISQVTFAEQQYGLGDIPLTPEEYNRYLKVYPDQLKDGLPASYDARSAGIVTSAKNQASCGSCWAFASAGAMESHILKAGGPTYDLSEQQQVSCNLTQSGCCGGSSNALQYWQTTGPILESCGPYAESGTSCPTQRTVACVTMNGCSQLIYRVTNWHTVSATTTDFKTSLYNYGPSYWRFVVYSDFQTFWNTASAGTVYKSAAGASQQGGHAVLLIGWDDAKGAFLCKNSWGATGGPQGDGTFWIAYSGHYYNLGFGMANFELAGGPTYPYCFKLGSWCNQIYLKVDGNKITGYDDHCGSDPTPIVGLFGSRWGFYIDFAETSSLGGLAAFLNPSGQMMYARFYKDGTVYDYGPLTFGPCTGVSEGASADEEGEGVTGDVLPDMGTICLKMDLFCDQLYVTNNYIASQGILFGYDNNCGDTAYTAAGFVLGNDFMIYGDFPEGSPGWGYALFGTVSGMGGSTNYLNLTGTAASLSFYSNFTFVPCTSVPDGMTPAALGPLAE